MKKAKIVLFFCLMLSAASSMADETASCFEHYACITNQWGVSMDDCYDAMNAVRKIPFPQDTAPEKIRQIFLDVAALSEPSTTNDYEMARWLTVKEYTLHFLGGREAVFGDTNCLMQAALEHGNARQKKPENPILRPKGSTEVVILRFSNEDEKRDFHARMRKAKFLNPAYSNLENALADPLQHCFGDSIRNRQGYPDALGMTIPELNAFVSSLVTAAQLTPEEATRYGLTNRFETVGGG